jgi:ABC-type multidrug transport system ATPase subunit
VATAATPNAKPAPARAPRTPRTPAAGKAARSAQAATDESLALLGADPVPEPPADAAAPGVKRPTARKTPAATPPRAAPAKRAPRAPRPKSAPKPAPVQEAPAAAEVPVAEVPVAGVPAAEVESAVTAATSESQPTETFDAVIEASPEVVEAVENVRPIERAPVDAPSETEVVLRISGLVKRFGDTTAVAGIDLEIEAGSFFGIVGPNGAGKTTTLSMVTGLLRPDAGSVTVHGADVWTNPVVAKRTMGVLPDRLRLFDRLTGAQLLYYSGILHGLEKAVVRSRSADLAAAFGLEDALNRLVTDYSAGMMKKIALAAAMIHSPRLLVLDEPFESVDPVSAANVIEILQKYVAAGGTVVMSSHTMGLIERICDSVAVVVNGAVLATGTMAEVRGGKTLEDRFVELAGGRKAAEGMEWLHRFSD